MLPKGLGKANVMQHYVMKHYATIKKWWEKKEKHLTKLSNPYIFRVMNRRRQLEESGCS